MNCREFNEASMLYFDREANEQQIKDLKEHMNICSSCRESFEGMEKMINLLEEPEDIYIDDDFTASVMEKVNAFEESRLKTAKLLERMVLPASLTFLCIGALLWVFLLNNINIMLVLYRGINLVKVMADLFVATILSSNVIRYVDFINAQLQYFLPLSLILIGVLVSSDSNKSKNHA